MSDEQSTRNNAHKLIDCILIAVLWLVAILLVHPMGNFPLNDDWAYASDVKNLLETGLFNPIGWTSMSLLTHVLWGSLWCSIFGFSFEVLRASTLIISLICLWNVYLIGREIGASRWLALLLTFSLAFNPIYFALSFTFMTEVSFMAFVSCATLFFIIYLKNNLIIHWWLAIVFCIIATLSRQTGLFLPLAFIFIFFMKKHPEKHATQYSQLAIYLLPFLLSFAALKLYESLMFSTGKIQALYGLQVDELKYLLLNIPEILPVRVLRNIYQASLYLGLMGLPIWVFLAFRTDDFPESSYGTGSRHTSYSTAKVVGTVFPISFLIAVMINDSQMPTLVGILETSGIGPRTLHDVYFLQIPTDELPPFFWKIITYVGALGTGLMWALLVCSFLFIFKKEKNNALGMFGRIRRTLLKFQTSKLSGLFLLLSATIYFVPFALVGFYDRYLLPLMIVVPLGVLGMWMSNLTPYQDGTASESGCRMTVSFGSVFGIFLVFLMAIFSITATHDYLAWNSARWQALHDLTVKENIPTTHIDGGFEFGGWYNFHEIEMAMDTQKSWWWVMEDDYILTFGEIPDYDIHSEYIYHSWWRGERRILVLSQCKGK